MCASHERPSIIAYDFKKSKCFFKKRNKFLQEENQHAEEKPVILFFTWENTFPFCAAGTSYTLKRVNS